MTDSWVSGRFMGSDDDIEETKMRCTGCGEVSEVNKPGINGKSMLTCRNCREQTIHKPEN